MSDKRVYRNCVLVINAHAQKGIVLGFPKDEALFKGDSSSSIIDRPCLPLLCV